MPLLSRDGMAFCGSIDGGKCRKHRYRRLRQETAQHVAAIAVGVFLQLATQPRIHLLGRQRGLPIDIQHIAVGRHVLQVRGGTEHHRAGNAEVREQHFTEVTVDDFTAHGILHRHSTVFRCQSLHRRAVAVRRLQRHQGRARIDDRMPRLARQHIAVALGAGLRIGLAARRQDHGIRRKRFAVFQGHAGANAVCKPQVLHTTVCKASSLVTHKTHQSIHHIHRLIRNGEHAVAALNLERHALRLDERHHVLRREGVERTVEKTRIARDVGDQRRNIAAVGEVAASLPGDHHLARHARVALHHRHRCAVFRRRPGGKQTGSAAADHQNVRLRHGYHPRPPTGRPPGCSTGFQAP